MCMSVICVCAVSACSFLGDQKRALGSYNWSYKWFPAVTWVLETEPQSPARAASAFNHRTTSPASVFTSLLFL